MKKIILFAICALFLTGCFSPVKPTKTNSYVINAEPQHIVKKRARSTTMLVLLPQTDAVYNTTAMAYSIKSHQISYYGVNQWAEPPAQMLLPLLVETLQKTQRYHAVVNAPYGGQYDYVLNTQIISLLQEYTYRPARLKLEVQTQLIRASSNRVIATRHYTIYEPLPTYSPYGGVLAANRATAQLLQQIAQFCVSKT